MLALTGVPEIRQKAAMDCGAAALAMVLAHLGRPAVPEAIATACQADPVRGIAAGRLRDHAKSLGFESYVIPGNFQDLHRELSMGRAVIAGMIKLTLGGPIQHYEVVVGYHPAEGTVVTLDPARGLRRYDVQGFFTEWQRAACVTIVVLPGKP